jgi:hypothetical protein
MFRRIAIACFGFVGVASAGGCTANVAGSWQVVDVKPRGASFPFNQVTFDGQGKYTSTGLYDSEGQMSEGVRTITGQVDRKGCDMRLVPAKGTAVIYKTRRRLDGKLEMTLRVPGHDRALTAVLTRPTTGPH